jgi:hypothetical protein
MTIKSFDCCSGPCLSLKALWRLLPAAEPIDWHSPETSYNVDLLTCAIVLFLQPARAVRAKHVLRIAHGGENFELLVAFLTFVRSAHNWTLMHLELAQETVRAMHHFAAYLNSGSILSISFVPPGSTTLLSTSFGLS